MSIFGRTEKDLHLLRQSPAELKAADARELEHQINHHCIRVAWRQHARTGVPVRDLLRRVTGEAYIRLNEVAPIDEFDEELLSIYLEGAESENRRVCIGFVLDDEARALSRAVVEGPFPPPHSMFEGHSMFLLLPYLPKSPTRLCLVRAGLLKLQDLRSQGRRTVAMAPLARETVRLVGAALERDPRLLHTHVLDSRLAFIESLIIESEPHHRGIQAARYGHQ